MANSRSKGSASKKAAAKKTSSRQAAKNTKKPSKPDHGIAREVLGVLLLCLGALVAYFLLVSPVRGMGRDIVTISKGLAGGVSFAVPILLWWVGIVVAFTGSETVLHPGRVFLITLMALLLLTLIHVFSADQIMLSARLYDYQTFLDRSYTYQTGGAGLLGALICWPLYRSLGVVGAVMVILSLIVVDLILLRKISLRKVGEATRRKAEEFQEQTKQRWEERSEQRRQAQLNMQSMRIPSVSEDVPAPTARRKGGMRVVRVTDETLSMDPKINPLPENSDDFGEDLPDFLADRRKKRKAAEKIHIAEPKPLPDIEAAPMPEGSEIAEDRPGPRKPRPASDDWIDERLLAGRTDGEAETPQDEDEEDVFIDPIIDIQPLEEEAEIPQPEKPKPPVRTAKRAKAVKQPSAGTNGVSVDVGTLLKAHKAPQETSPTEYTFPSINLLARSKPTQVHNQEESDLEKGKKLIDTLASFGISARLTGIAHGPTVTRFEIAPTTGTKVSRITSLADDIALNLAAISVRIEAPIPGKAAVGVEVPNEHPETVPLREVLESDACVRNASRLAVALGKDNAGKPVICDLARMPHILIAGQTGSGKSVCINCIITSILYRATPEEVRMIMIDPKMVELSMYNGIPHLEVPVVTDPRKAAQALEWAVTEMARRYRKFADLKVHDLKGYNQKRPDDEPAMPQMVIIIDELADLMLVSPKEVEDAINRLAALARAAGIHLVIATQRPSVNVITGVIKANIPSRIAFTVASQVDSRTILDSAGAEKLLGSGDMLYYPSGKGKTRVQGAWVSDEEVRAVVDSISVEGENVYNEDAQEHIENANLSDQEKQDRAEDGDPLLAQAIELVIQAGQASVSMLQRRLRVGHSRAGRLIDEMEIRGIVGPDEGSKSRKVLMTREEYYQDKP